MDNIACYLTIDQNILWTLEKIRIKRETQYGTYSSPKGSFKDHPLDKPKLQMCIATISLHKFII